MSHLNNKITVLSKSGYKLDSLFENSDIPDENKLFIANVEISQQITFMIEFLENSRKDIYDELLENIRVAQEIGAPVNLKDFTLKLKFKNRVVKLEAKI